MMTTLAAAQSDPNNAIRALQLFGVLCFVLLFFVVMIGIITARRRARLRREAMKAQRTVNTDAWVESGRRLDIDPSEIRRKGPRLPDDRDPPPHDDDPPDDPRGKWRPR